MFVNGCIIILPQEGARVPFSCNVPEMEKKSTSEGLESWLRSWEIYELMFYCLRFVVLRKRAEGSSLMSHAYLFQDPPLMRLDDEYDNRWMKINLNVLLNCFQIDFLSSSLTYPKVTESHVTTWEMLQNIADFLLVLLSKSCESINFFFFKTRKKLMRLLIYKSYLYIQLCFTSAV